MATRSALSEVPKSVEECAKLIAALKIEVSSQKKEIIELKTAMKSCPLPKNMGERLAIMASNHSLPKSLFDFTQFASRPVALKIAYCGWDLYGLTCQDNDYVETVEFYLYAALISAKLIKNQHECRWSRSGRTDKGVSSYGQVVSLFMRSALAIGTKGTLGYPLDVKESMGCALADEDDTEELPYVTMINRYLPAGIRVLEWAATDGAFDSSTHRMYKYYIPRKGLNLDAMKIAANLYVGNHNFRNFCKPDLQRLENQSFVRSIYEADVYDISEDDRTNSDFRNESFLVFRVKGKGFLWHQVRMMVSMLILIGKGRETGQVILELLDVEKNPRKPSYDMACELPLVLVECGYDNTALNWKTDASKSTTKDKIVSSFMGMWRSVSTKQMILAGVLGNQYKGKDIVFQEPDRGKMYTPVMKLTKMRSAEETMAWLMKTPRKRYPFTMVGQSAGTESDDKLDSSTLNDE